ncbi:hypothetical protein RHMOL_Rhmol07G0158700 [Rhododendron molle]|uniref:Uncharacterized protein n=1 Tax=Rhododendron molle TaxID=49168 RepID=A0ACC0N281_RHOML|nr:hypothetical protein RHMOL_Rhmol07G0158700 [Rhododendron molle]
MADHCDGGGEGEVIDRVEDRGGPMETQTGDRTTVEEAAGVSAVVTGSGGDGGEDQQQEVSDEEKDRVTEVNPRARVLSGAVGSIPEAEGSSAEAEGPPMVGGDSGDGSNSGAVGDDTGTNGSPPRDSMKGKGVAVEEEHVKDTTGEETMDSCDIPGRGHCVQATGDSSHLIASHADHL